MEFSFSSATIPQCSTTCAAFAAHRQPFPLRSVRYPNSLQQCNIRPFSSFLTVPKAMPRSLFYSIRLVGDQLLGINYPLRNPQAGSFTNFGFRSWENRRLLKSCELSDESLGFWFEMGNRPSTFEVSPFGRKIFWCASWESKRLKESGDLSRQEFLRRKRISDRSSRVPPQVQGLGVAEQSMSFTPKPVKGEASCWLPSAPSQRATPNPPRGGPVFPAPRLARAEVLQDSSPSGTPDNPPDGQTDSHTVALSEVSEHVQSLQEWNHPPDSSQGAEASSTPQPSSLPQQTLPEPSSTSHIHHNNTTTHQNNHSSVPGPFHQPSSQPWMNSNSGPCLRPDTPGIWYPSAGFSQTLHQFQNPAWPVSQTQPGPKVISWRTGTDNFQEASHTMPQQQGNFQAGFNSQNQLAAHHRMAQEVMRARLAQPDFPASSPPWRPATLRHPQDASGNLFLLGTQIERPQERGPGEENRKRQGSGVDTQMEQRSEEWFALRESRLTASAFCKALGFFGKDRVELWEEKIGLKERFAGNAATSWGQNMEPKALGHYETVSGNEVASFPFQIYGSTTGDSSKNWLGASPDGLLKTDSLGGNESPGILEIKCPFNKGYPYQAQPHSVVPYYYIPQIQGLLEILDRDWLDFYSWTMGGSTVIRVERDEKLWGVMFSSMEDLWHTNVLPARQIVREMAGLGPGKNTAYIAKFLKSNPLLLQEAQRAVEMYRPKEQYSESEAIKKACQGKAIEGRILKQAGPL